MKIGILSTSFFGCPNPAYGGLEAVNWNLACGLTARGHKVILYAPDNSQTPPGGFLYKTGPALDTVNVDWMNEEKADWENVKHTFGELDILLGSNWFGFEYLSKKENPELRVTHVHHGGLNSDWWKPGTAPFKLNIIGISQHMRRVYESQGFPTHVVYNGIDAGLYPPSHDKSDRFLFLGRIDPIKGVHIAIDAARRADVPLDVVGATSFVTNQQYVSQMNGMCDGEKVKFVGEVDHETKVKYLQDAKALIVASQFGEPFNLCAAEAMACGTPVITLNDGGLPEVVEHGVTGFVCQNIYEMEEAIMKIDDINYDDCINRVQNNFTKEKMAENYEKQFTDILAGNEW